MLQQTRVETVLPYYARFLRELPDVASLAEAPEEQVLALWSGLGYYRRARMLHAAAKTVAGSLGGRLPEEPAQLRRLEGIGAYTAGAMASIAFGRRAALVDGNVARVLARLFALECDVKSAAGTAAVWAVAEHLVSRVDGPPGDWNQALMELGATVCIPARAALRGMPRRDLLPGSCAGDRGHAAADLPQAQTAQRAPGRPGRLFDRARRPRAPAKAGSLRRPLGAPDRGWRRPAAARRPARHRRARDTGGRSRRSPAVAPAHGDRRIHRGHRPAAALGASGPGLRRRGDGAHRRAPVAPACDTRSQDLGGGGRGAVGQRSAAGSTLQAKVTASTSGTNPSALSAAPPAMPRPGRARARAGRRRRVGAAPQPGARAGDARNDGRPGGGRRPGAGVHRADPARRGAGRHDDAGSGRARSAGARQGDGGAVRGDPHDRIRRRGVGGRRDEGGGVSLSDQAVPLQRRGLRTRWPRPRSTGAWPTAPSSSSRSSSRRSASGRSSATRRRSSTSSD